MRRQPKAHRNIVYLCTDHVVWCPKYRRPVLRGAVREHREQIIREVARERRAEVLEVTVMPDHVHLLVDGDPQYGIHRPIKRMKGRSSHVLRATVPPVRSRLPPLWTNSYFVATVGGAPLATVTQSIEQQRHV
jgi:putative transposase